MALPRPLLAPPPGDGRGECLAKLVQLVLMYSWRALGLPSLTLLLAMPPARKAERPNCAQSSGETLTTAAHPSPR
eukprot:6990798-Lingulodinium_polyedra.AAC.1